MDLKTRRAARFERERKTIENMIKIYCADKHHSPGLCGDCRELLEYSVARLDKCPHGEEKPSCNNCTIHCYDPPHRNRVRSVMKHAGPRMLLRHPTQALTHITDELRSK